VPSLAVIDASFISLRLLLGPTLGQLEMPATVVALVKPQFEVGRDAVGKGGVVRDAHARERAVAAVAAAAAELGLEVTGSCASPITGAKKGNVEFFLHLGATPRAAAGEGGRGV
jgi:23S rRNA (cytidine1920-2'-O)/16S rRNA (cytidine1409-2'-O)-methyltransferase